MATIGINTTSNKEVTSYIKVLENAGHTIVDLKNKPLVQELDTILIPESATGDLKNICEQILTLKTQTNALIWILSTNFVQINRIIYLQLVTDLVIDLKQEETDSFLLQLDNTLKRIKKTIHPIDADSTGGTEEKSDTLIQLFPESLRVSLDNQKKFN